MPPLERPPARVPSASTASWRRTSVQVTAVLLILVMTGCGRLTFMRQNTSRKGFDSTAHEVVITNHGRPGVSGAVARVQIAQMSLAKGDFAAAERDARLALKLDPGSAAAYTVLAIIQDRIGKATVAEQHYRRAAELAPTQGGMLNNYGTWLCSNGRAAESLAWFDRALAAPGYQTPDVAAANAGACALQAGQGARAQQSLLQAVALNPQNELALSSMAELEFKAGRLMEARAFSERRLAAAPADPAALILASQIEHRLGDNAAAEDYVRRLRAQFPDTQMPESGIDGRR